MPLLAVPCPPLTNEDNRHPSPCFSSCRVSRRLVQHGEGEKATGRRGARLPSSHAQSLGFSSGGRTGAAEGDQGAPRLRGCGGDSRRVATAGDGDRKSVV